MKEVLLMRLFLLKIYWREKMKKKLIKDQHIIWMTMILSILILVFYLLSYTKEAWILFLIMFIFERIITPYTGKRFEHTLDQLGEILDKDLDESESKRVLKVIVSLIAFVIVAIGIYIYALISHPLLCTILMLAEIIDKIIEKFILKRV